MMRRSVASSSRRRAMKSAAKSVSASFMSSEGCRRNWPKPTQRLEPIGVHAEARDEHDEEEAEGHEQEQGAEAPQLAVVDAQRDSRGRRRRWPSTCTSRIRMAQGVP